MSVTASFWSPPVGTGPAGPAGPIGPPGAMGIPGLPGDDWRSDIGVPAIIAGDDEDDHYLDLATGIVYQVIAGVWVPQGSIQGPPGDDAQALFPIWAEESGALSDNNLQFSFGNGATGLIGIPMPFNVELVAASMQAETIGTTLQAQIWDINANALIWQSNYGAVSDGIDVLPVPIALAAGTVVGFRTGAENGAWADVRFAAWLRRV